MKVEPAPVMSAANADVDAATKPAATIAFKNFIAGLHLVSEAPDAPDRAHAGPFRSGQCRFYEGLMTAG
jgi:hypothetical protein